MGGKAEKNIVQLGQLLYLFDLAPCDIFHITDFKGIIKEAHFKGSETIKKVIKIELEGILEESFQQCIKSYKEEWKTTITLRIILKGKQCIL